MHENDLKLTSALLGGDEASFDRFYATYFPKIYRFCYSRLRNEASAEDIVQQTFINAMRGLSNYRGEASLHTWLCQIARNEIFAVCRKNETQHSQSSSLDDSPDLMAALESLSEASFTTEQELELINLVQLCLDKLPSAYSDSLEMKYIEGMSVSEIAQRMGTNNTTVQSLLARARSAFKAAFTDLNNEFQLA